MQCPHCGAPTTPMLYRCGHCGAVLPPPPGAMPATAPEPIAEEEPAEARNIKVLGVWAAIAIALIWVTTSFYVIGFVPLAKEYLTTEMNGDPFAKIQATVPTGLEAFRALVLVGPPALTTAATVMADLLILPSAAAFLVWLFLARRNLRYLPEATPRWGEPWTITAWFIPIVGLFIGASVIADVARNSVDGVRPRDGFVIARRAWWWLIFIVVAGWAPNLGLLVQIYGGFPGFEVSDTGLFISPILVGIVIGALSALAAASRITSVIARIGAEHRQRLERDWDRGLGQRAALGFDPYVPGRNTVP